MHNLTRAKPQANRVMEIKKMGFKRCLVPESNLKRMAGIDDIELAGIKNISEAMELLF